MEGFTSSLHVKGATAKRVQQAVTDLLSAEGFQVLSAETTDPAEGEALITRGVWIAKTKGDWVSLFCSDFLFQQEIGRELSKQLKTHALNVWVNESASWHYSLFHNGEEIDQFDSIGDPDELQEFLDNDMDELADEFDDEDEDDDLAGEENGAGESDADDDSPVQAGLLKIAELQEQIAGKMPEDVRAIYEKLNEGKASLGEMRRFDQWSQANQAELSRFQEQLQEQTAELTTTMQGVFQQGLAENLSENSEMLNGALPPDIAELFSKVLSGQANGDELKRFAEQMSEEAEEDEEEEEEEDVGAFAPSIDADGIAETTFSAEENDDDDEGLFEDDEDDRCALTEQQLQVHLGALKPLLDKSVDAAAVAETLTTQDDSPEEPLGELLSLLGIESNLATLDFDSFEDLDSADLAEQGIKLNPLLLVRST